MAEKRVVRHSRYFNGQIIIPSLVQSQRLSVSSKHIGNMDFRDSMFLSLQVCIGIRPTVEWETTIAIYFQKLTTGCFSK